MTTSHGGGRVIDLAALAARKDNVKRDDYGRYLLPALDSESERPWTRTTTITKTLEDTEKLEEWKQRKAAQGFRLRPDLLEQIPTDDPADRDEKKAVNELIEEAQKAAGMGERADLGTLLHACTEEIDHGRATPGDFPEPFRSDLTAYVRLVRRTGIEMIPEYIESIVINPAVDCAGTIDRIGRTPDTNLRIIDVKTGDNLHFPRMGYAAQFGTYANASHLFLGEGKGYRPMPPVDLDWGLLVHLPAGKAIAELLWVDLRLGWHVAQRSYEARLLRARLDFLIPTDAAELHMQAGLLNDIRLASTVAELESLWVEFSPLWSALHIEAARTRKADLQTVTA